MANGIKSKREDSNGKAKTAKGQKDKVIWQKVKREKKQNQKVKIAKKITVRRQKD